MSWTLSCLLFIPIFFAFLILLLPDNDERFAKYYKWLNMLACTLLLLICSGIYYFFPNKGVNSEATLFLVEKVPWIHLDLGGLGKLEINYFLGLDSLNVSIVLLASIVLWIGAIASWGITHKKKGYFSLYLLLSGAIMGTFCALDFFLFYICFELMLLPMYFLIGIWGGERREYAALKFFLYTLTGSIFILIALIALYLSFQSPDTKHYTFNLIEMSDARNLIAGSLLASDSSFLLLGQSLRTWVFWLLIIGFLIKLPVVPFHTWLPDAHVEAPTPVSVVLAGILLKIGGYGILRIAYPIFPDIAREASTTMAILGTISILYGALNALAQADLKKMVAYSSVSHMGFVLLGIGSLSAEGFNGAVFQMFSHGVLSAMLFVLVGILYERTHSRQIADYSGLLSAMPQYAVFSILAFFASLGLPLFSGFIGELFTVMGGFRSQILPIWIPALATLGIVLGAAYFVWTLQKIFLGKFWLKNPHWQLTDLNKREKIMLVTLIGISLAIGIYPQLILRTTQTGMQILLQMMQK